MFIKTSLGLIAATALALVASSGAAAASNPSCTALSADLLKNLQAGNFTAATAHFDVTMKAMVSPQRIQQAWKQSLPQLFGAFKRAATPTEMHKDDNDLVSTALQFEHAWAKMIVACNAENQISGWRILPGSAPKREESQAPASATAWVAEATVGAKTLPIKIQRDGFVLKGVLDLPAGKGPFGVVDIIPGSGPVTLNGNDGPITYSPYKKLAAKLVEAGWAVARVAKRGIPPSTGDANRIVFEGQVADNLAIVEALKNNPHINPQRIVVAGHSIGGLIAPKLATETQLAGLILLEAPGESMKKISMAQVLEMNQQAGASATQLQAIVKQQKAAYALFAKTPPGQSVSIAGKTYPADAVQLFKSWYAQKPLETAHEVNIPVLVVQGGLDFNVPAGNGKRLIKAFAHAQLLYLPKMGHALNVAPCRCVEQLDTGKDATLAPGLAAGIIAWLNQLL